MRTSPRGSNTRRSYRARNTTKIDARICHAGRISTPEEFARLIAFVASPNNINGAEYLIDGGIVGRAFVTEA
jgi:NAD(P)-dependent dehydrogenase (short-subunit alcohol dehydrogenase family)